MQKFELDEKVSMDVVAQVMAHEMLEAIEAEYAATSAASAAATKHVGALIEEYEDMINEDMAVTSLVGLANPQMRAVMQLVEAYGADCTVQGISGGAGSQCAAQGKFFTAQKRKLAGTAREVFKHGLFVEVCRMAYCDHATQKFDGTINLHLDLSEDYLNGVLPDGWAEKLDAAGRAAYEADVAYRAASQRHQDKASICASAKGEFLSRFIRSSMPDMAAVMTGAQQKYLTAKE